MHQKNMNTSLTSAEHLMNAVVKRYNNQMHGEEKQAEESSGGFI